METCCKKLINCSYGDAFSYISNLRQHAAVLRKEWEEAAKEAGMGKIVKYDHTNESFMLVLSVIVTTVKLNVCQAKAYRDDVKYCQAKHNHFAVAQVAC